MTGSRTNGPGHFFIIGAMKAGTTSLYKYLAGHPDLYPSPRKEPRIFRDAGDACAQRSALDALFASRGREAWCFEASTAYTKFPQFTGVPERIRAAVPDARLVYLVRHPVERAWSQYVHNLAHGRETRAFTQAMVEERQYLDISRYHLQLQQYLRTFPRERILVQVFEEMVQDPAATVRAVCEFLEVDSSYRPVTGEVAYNASSQKRKAPAPLRVARTLGVEEVIPWRARRWLTSRADELPARRTSLTPDLRSRIVDALADDTRALFGALGRAIPAWPEFA